MQNPTPKDAILPVTVMLAMHTMVAFCIFVVPVLAPEMGMSARQVSRYMPVIYITAMLLAPLSGALTGRFGPLRMMQICVLSGCIGIALCTSGEEIVMLLGAVFIGASLGPATPAASDILLRYTPTSIRSLIFSIKQAAVPLSNVSAGLLVPLAVAIGWRNGLWIAVAAGLVMVVAVQPLQKKWDAGRDTGTQVTFSRQSMLNGLRILVSDPPLRWLSISSFCFVLLQISAATYLVIFMVERIGIAHETAGTIYAFAFSGGFFGRIVFGIVADNFISPLKTLGILGLVMGAAGIGAAQFTAEWPLWAIGAMTLLLASTSAGWNGVYISEVATLAPKGQASNVMGMSLVLTYCGCIITPGVFGAILALTDSFRTAYIVFAIPSILVGIRLLLLKKDKD